MKKLSEYQDEEALNLLADLIDPTIEIFGDKEVAVWIRAKIYIKAVQVALRKHPEDVIKMMSLLEGVPREEYHFTLKTLPKMLFDVMRDPELQDFFELQGRMASETPTGSATESTEEVEEPNIS